MITNLGNYLQICTILFSILIVAGVICRANARGIVMIFYFSCLSTLLAFLLLVYGFVVSDFSVMNVFLNSSTLKPIGFKIAASWASHEGSILLWLCLLQIVGSIYTALFNSHSPQLYHIMVLALIQLFFSSFIFFTSNPFDALSFRPAQGLGLNPMLQDIALIIHPPILYLGYVCYVIPFTSACVILYISDLDLAHLKAMKLFSNLGMLFSTAGIALGSWWAYRELGWGGFWFFDPVENISLLPWLAGIVLHHSVLLTIKSGRMLNWTITLSVITFLLVVLATFLVRSGLITSIHAFASSSERAIYLLSIFAILAISSLSLLVVKGRVAISEKVEFPKISIMIWGGGLFLIALTVLLCATIYPIVYSLLYQQSITISEGFFINNFIIFIIPTLLLAAIAQADNTRKIQLSILVCSLIITLISSYQIQYGVISACSMTMSIFLIMQTCYYLLIKSDFFRKKPEANIAMILGHLGFGLLVLAITINSLLQREINFIGKVGDKVNAEGLEITLKDIRVSHGINYYRQITEFWVQDQNNITILKPENRFYIIEKQLSQESNIYSYLTHDLYAVLNKIDNNIIHAKIYYKPMMSFIWISIILIIGGFLVRLLDFLHKSNLVGDFVVETCLRSSRTRVYAAVLGFVSSKNPENFL